MVLVKRIGKISDKKKYLSLFLFLMVSLFFHLYAQQFQISYPDHIESSPRQIVNIPIVCENISNYPLTIYADYYNTFGYFDKSYTINQISPKLIEPGRKELIFLSLIPAPDLLAGRRFFPFYIRDTSNRILTNGVIDIRHVIVEDLDIIPLTSSTFLIQNEETEFGFLFVNRGSVPIEFKVKETQETMVIQPAKPDTMYVKLNEIITINRYSHWINISMDYVLTKILPTGLVSSEHTLYSVIPIAQRTRYPNLPEYYTFPMNLSYSFMYDESDYNTKNYFRYHRLTLFGSGFIDQNQSPYLSYNINYRHNNLSFRSYEEITYFFSWKSKILDVSFGENGYLLDLKRYPKWGEGFSLAFKPSFLLIEQTFLKEQYKDKPYHNATSIGVVWDKTTFLNEPEQYVKLRHYQKNSRTNDHEWWVIGNNKITEHQKYILESQVKITNQINLHLEAYTADDNLNENFSNAAFSTQAIFNTQPLFNRFSMLYDNLNINNETSKKENYSNELNINLEPFRMYTSAQYIDEVHIPNWTGHYHNTAHNEFANIYVNLIDDFSFRTKLYNAESKTIAPNYFKYSETEVLSGAMYKTPIIETEVLFGVKEEKYGIFESSAFLIDLNLAYSDFLNFTLYNRIAFDEDDINITTQAQIYKRWTDFVSSSTGLYNAFYQNQDWNNYLSTYTYLFFQLPWKHNLRLGGTYSFNPYFTQNYRFSIFGEYSIPINPNILPKIGKNHKNIYLLDPWQRKPITNAVFEIDNQYYITNEGGQIRVEREKLKSNNVKIINLPEAFTVSSDLATLGDYPRKNIELQVIGYSTLKINVKKLTYQRVALTSVTESDNLAYYQNQLVNTDRHTIETYTQRLEIVLQNVNDQTKIIRAFVNEEGNAIFEKMPIGDWEIHINSSYTNDAILLDTKHIVKVQAHENLIQEILVKEDVTRFIRFE